MASSDPVYCVHISTALWLEVFIESSPVAQITPYLFAFSDDVTIPRGGEKAKATVQNIYLTEVFKRPEFENTGPVGSHSIRKYASTDVRNKGASKDEKDMRGRWKSGTLVSDVYNDIELPYPNAKVAALLCIGGIVNCSRLLGHIIHKSSKSRIGQGWSRNYRGTATENTPYMQVSFMFAFQVVFQFAHGSPIPGNKYAV